ncbi:MAG: hypothetical protein ACFCUW_05115 [Kiloniellaceae bacterium]
MSRSVIFTTLAASALALGLAACDEQQASDSSSVPMQQQGAVPSGESSAPAPMTPESGAEPSMQPETEQPEDGTGDALPGSSQ